MTETPQDQGLPLHEPRTGTVTTDDGLLFDAPKDAPEAVATGYKAYDRTLGRYVGPTTEKKPSSGDMKKLAAEGHKVVAVRV